MPSKLSDFGQRMRVVPGTEQDFTLVIGERDYPPHWHVGEVRRMHAQVVQCPCGFWLPIGCCCPSCGRHGRHP